MFPSNSWQSANSMRGASSLGAASLGALNSVKPCPYSPALQTNGLAVVCVAPPLPATVHCCHMPQKFEFTESTEASVVNHFTPGEAKTKVPWLSCAGTMPMAQSLE